MRIGHSPLVLSIVKRFETRKLLLFLKNRIFFLHAPHHFFVLNRPRCPGPVKRQPLITLGAGCTPALLSLEAVETGQLLAAQVSPFLVMTRAELYAVFAQQWCDREVTHQLNEEPAWTGSYTTAPQKWKDEHSTRVRKVLDLCKELAYLLFMEGKTQIEIHEPSPENNALPAEAPSLKITNDFSTRVSNMFAGHRQEWLCSPLKKSGSFFSFLHKTVQEYFVALAVC